jgi:transcriptional regulator with XRE-family HTH domain
MALKRTLGVGSRRASAHRGGAKGGRRQSRAPARRELSQRLGESAREARKRAGLTQADVAERIGVATEVYGRMERGLVLPSVTTLQRLCLVLQTPADLLLGLSAERGASWAREPALPPEPPPLRRLLRTLRHLQGPELRALGVMASLLRRES